MNTNEDLPCIYNIYIRVYHTHSDVVNVCLDGMARTPFGLRSVARFSISGGYGLLIRRTLFVC